MVESNEDAILPSHAWMVGVVAEPDGSLTPPPIAAGPDPAILPPDDVPTCTCPDFCAVDHGLDDL
jgi:hypothetical protein